MTIKIGVLGGIGPEATGEFYNKLINELQKRNLIKSNQDFPQIIINSIPAPELIYDEISEKELEPYLSGLKELENLGIDFIVMVCNTIHLYYEQLQSKIKVPIINLRTEIENQLTKKSIKSALIIGTPNTINHGLYQFDDIHLIKPNEEEIKKLSNLIFNFNKGINKEKQIQETKRICIKYLSKGAETVILGCTEFAVMLNNEDIPKINTIDVLVDATIDRFIQLKT